MQLRQEITTKIRLLKSLKSKLKFQYHNWQKSSTIKIKGVQIPVTRNMTMELKKALYGGYYEKYELKTISSQLEPNDVVMELGTGMGLLSSFCARKIGSDRVFTYEANPGLKPLIHQTYCLNKVSPQLEICILGSKPGNQTFYISKNIWDSSIIQYDKQLQPIQVTVKSFNEEIQKINPSFLIMDIEGGEYELCQYADFHHVKKLSMELHESIIGSQKAELVKSKLREAGFRLNEQLSYRQRELFWERN